MSALERKTPDPKGPGLFFSRRRKLSPNFHIIAEFGRGFGHLLRECGYASPARIKLMGYQEDGRTIDW
jgi:hypothetical protein